MIVCILAAALVLFGAYHLFRAYQSGDLQTYFYKKAAEKVSEKTNLTPTQQEYIESGDFDSLAKDIEENITPEQVDCAVQAVGEERAQELMTEKNPTPQEILKLSKCL